MLGRRVIKSWSSTQASVSLSSGEADFYCVVKANGVALVYQSLPSAISHDLPIRVWTNRAATLGICGRQGLGRLRHIETQCLRIQQRVMDRTVGLINVRGEEDPADLFMRHLTGRDRIHHLLELFRCRYVSGRAAIAPWLRAVAVTTEGEFLNVAQHTMTTRCFQQCCLRLLSSW